MTVGERIKEIRTKLGMSQVSFADKINVSKQTLYKYENNIITNIPSDKIEAAAKLGNVSPAYLMGWENEEEMKWAEEAYMVTASTAIEGLYAAFKDKEVNHFKDYVKLTDNHKNMVDNYTKKLLSIQDMEHEAELNAAHARTDIDVPEGTDASDNDIMDDDDF